MGKGHARRTVPLSPAKRDRLIKAAGSPDLWRKIHALREDILALETVAGFLRSRSSFSERNDEFYDALCEVLNDRIWELWVVYGPAG